MSVLRWDLPSKSILKAIGKRIDVAADSNLLDARAAGGHRPGVGVRR